MDSLGIISYINDKAKKATTLAGYGITDAYSASTINKRLSWNDNVTNVCNNTEVKATTEGGGAYVNFTAKDCCTSAGVSLNTLNTNTVKISNDTAHPVSFGSYDGQSYTFAVRKGGIMVYRGTEGCIGTIYYS